MGAWSYSHLPRLSCRDKGSRRRLFLLARQNRADAGDRVAAARGLGSEQNVLRIRKCEVRHFPSREVAKPFGFAAVLER